MKTESDQNVVIKLLEGLNHLPFGAMPKDLIAWLGQAQDVQQIQEEETASTCYAYPSLGYFFYFDKNDELDIIEIENDEVELFDVDVFFLQKKELIFLMESKGHPLSEEETLDNEEEILYFDTACVDFYFENEQLSIITFTKDY